MDQRVKPGDWKETDLVEARVESYLKQIADEIASDETRPNVLIRKGNAETEIHRTASALKYSAVVLATRRVSALSRAVLGSVTDKVVKSSAIPVITTNPESTMTLASSPTT